MRGISTLHKAVVAVAAVTLAGTTTMPASGLPELGGTIVFSGVGEVGWEVFSDPIWAETIGSVEATSSADSWQWSHTGFGTGNGIAAAGEVFCLTEAGGPTVGWLTLIQLDPSSSFSVACLNSDVGIVLPLRPEDPCIAHVSADGMVGGKTLSVGGTAIGTCTLDVK